MTKQDVGHTYFHNTMFFGERVENVKIVGRGRITGDGNLVTGDKVMNNNPERRCDKMFTFKLCRDIEIGGIENDLDLWYDEKRMSHTIFLVMSVFMKILRCFILTREDILCSLLLEATGFMYMTRILESTMCRMREIFMISWRVTM